MLNQFFFIEIWNTRSNSFSPLGVMETALESGRRSIQPMRIKASSNAEPKAPAKW